MNRNELKELKMKSKAGNVLALHKYLEHLYNESLDKYLAVSADHRYYQARCNAFQDIINVLPEISE